MDPSPRWLSAEQQAAWDSFIRMQEQLVGRLSRLVQADSAMSASDYLVLVKLTGPGGRMRFMDLCAAVQWEKSRMSHQVARMARRGLVEREQCPEDGRGAFIAATPAGWAAIRAAAPAHVDRVRRLFIDALSPEELADLARISDRLLDHMARHPD